MGDTFCEDGDGGAGLRRSELVWSLGDSMLSTTELRSALALEYCSGVGVEPVTLVDTVI